MRLTDINESKNKSHKSLKGVDEALNRNKKFAEELRKGLEEFEKWWCNKAPLQEEAEAYLKSHPNASVDDVCGKTTATTHCFFKYVKVPKGTPNVGK
jgi:hypothetical protein